MDEVELKKTTIGSQTSAVLAPKGEGWRRIWATQKHNYRRDQKIHTGQIYLHKIALRLVKKK